MTTVELQMTTKYKMPLLERLGGVREISRGIGVNPGTVSRWAKRGAIPVGNHKRLLAFAAEKGVEVSAGDWSA